MRLLVNDKDLRPLGDDEVFLHQIKGAIVVDSLEKLLGEVVEIKSSNDWLIKAGYVEPVNKKESK